MSPSWSNVQTGGIFPDRVWWRERPRFGRSAGLLRSEVLVETSGPDAVAALRRVPGVTTSSCGSGEWVLGSRWFRFGILPWELQSGRNGDDSRAALIHSGSIGPDAATDEPSTDCVALAPARFGKGRLYAVCEPALVRALVADDVVTPARWRPWAVAAAAAVLPGLGRDPITLAVIEIGQATFLHCRDGWPEQVGVRRFPAGNQSALAGLLQTEQVRQGGGVSMRVIVDMLPPAAADVLREAGFAVVIAAPDLAVMAGQGISS